LGIQLLKNFELQGTLPLNTDQGLSPWTLLGAVPPDPRFSLFLCLVEIKSWLRPWLMAESAYTLQWAPLSTRIAPSHGDHLDLPCNTMLSAQTSPQPKRHLDRFSGLCTDDRGVSLYFTMAWLFSLKIVPSHVGIWTSFNTWFIWPTRVCNTNGNLIASAIFAGLTDWKSDRKTDRPCYSVRCAAKQLTKCTNKPYAIV